MEIALLMDCGKIQNQRDRHLACGVCPHVLFNWRGKSPPNNYFVLTGVPSTRVMIWRAMP